MKLYLIIIILVVAVLATIALTGYIYYLLTKRFFDNQRKTQMLQMRIDEHREAVKLVTPIRLQAYERMALYLERISPDSLVLRCYQPGMDTKLLQGVMETLDKNGISFSDARHIPMYEDWLRLKTEGHKYIYIIHYLSQQYEMSETSVYRIIRKFSEDCF